MRSRRCWRVGRPSRRSLMRLMSVSGVNLICAASFMAAIGEASRFLTSRRLVAYLGLDLKGPPIRRDTSAVRSDLQARVGVRALGAGRSGVERGQVTRPAARVLRAPARPALTKKKQRQLALTAGAKPRTKAAAGIWSTNRAIGDAERALAEQAEVSYQRMVTDQKPDDHHEKWARARHRSAHRSGPRRGIAARQTDSS